MTQAFNLSQLANNLNSSGQLDATDGLVNSVPVANGGTGASSASAARTNLGVPQGSTTTAVLGSWVIEASSTTLLFKYGGSTVFTLDSSGNITPANVTSSGEITATGNVVAYYGS
jgi:hypothetical protein